MTHSPGRSSGPETHKCLCQPFAWLKGRAAVQHKRLCRKGLREQVQKELTQTFVCKDTDVRPADGFAGLSAASATQTFVRMDRRTAASQLLRPIECGMTSAWPGPFASVTRPSRATPVIWRFHPVDVSQAFLEGGLFGKH